jgi:hypothetical protein
VTRPLNRIAGPAPQVPCRTCKITVSVVLGGLCPWCEHPPAAKPTDASRLIADRRNKAWEAHMADVVAVRKAWARRVLEDRGIDVDALLDDAA